MHLFDKDLVFKDKGNHRLRAEVSNGWSHRGNLNGGFLLAMAAKAVSRYSEKTGSLLITANYLNRTIPGDIDIHVEELSTSRNFDRFEVTLIQNEQKVLRTFCTLSTKTGETEDLSGSRDYLPSAKEEDCIEMSRPEVTPIYDILSVRINPATAGWMKDDLKKPGHLNGWIRFKESRPFDIPAINLAVDCFPPSIFSTLGASAWVPTLELSVYINGAMEYDALWSDFHTHYITDGILVEDGIVTGPDGRIKAVSRQTAVYRQKT